MGLNCFYSFLVPDLLSRTPFTKANITKKASCFPFFIARMITIALVAAGWLHVYWLPCQIRHSLKNYIFFNNKSLFILVFYAKLIFLFITPKQLSSE